MPDVLAEMPKSVRDLFLEDVGLSVRCCRSLKHEGIATMGQLMSAPETVLAEFQAELLAALKRAKGRIREYASNQ